MTTTVTMVRDLRGETGERRRTKPQQGQGDRSAKLFLRRIFIHDVGGESAPGDLGPEYLLTVEEACRRLRISRWKLYDLIRQRKLSTIKIGTRRLIPEQALTDLVDRLSGGEAD